MSYPILYSSIENDFSHNGFGILSDCASCEVKEDSDNLYELDMRYPMDGIHFSDIQCRSIIKVTIDEYRNPQLFRVKSISKPNIYGIVNIYAQHISYDLSGIPISPFSASNVLSALNGLKENAVSDCPFEFWTDKVTQAEFKCVKPASIRSVLGGSKGSILDIFGGQFEFDNYSVKLHNNRGVNRGVSIRYGKNLKDIKQEENCANIATAIYPYWCVDFDGETVCVELPEKIIKAPGTYNFEKILTVDFSQVFEMQPSVEQLREAAEKYIRENEIGVPTVSITVSFEQLEKYEEYNHLKVTDRVSLFDPVNVEFPELGVSATAKAVEIVHDIIAEKIKSVTLGSVTSKIYDTILEQKKELENVPTKTELDRAKESATSWLTNGKGYKVERRDKNGTVIDTLYLDTPDINTAVNVLRIGQSGIGFSRNGVGGPYESAWTIDGTFNADWIGAGTLYGLLLKAGRIESEDGKITIDLNSGAESAVFNSGISTNGLNVRKDEIGAESLFSVDVQPIAENVGFEVVVSMANELGEKFLTMAESRDVEGTKTGGYLELKNSDGFAATLKSNTYGGSLILQSPVNGNYVEIEASSESNPNRSKIKVDTISPGANSDFEWVYSETIGRVILCKK